MRLGVIFVCYINGELRELYYPDRPPKMNIPGFHGQVLLEIKNGETIPSFDGAGFFHRAAKSKVLSGEEVLQRPASDKEIRTFLEKWTKDFRCFTIAEWTDRLPQYQGLLEEEKNRLTSLAKSFC